MSEEGARIRARRERLGYKQSPFADLVGIHRNTLAALESGQSYNRTTMAKIERVLDELEEEAGITAPPAEPEKSPLVEFEVNGDRVIVRGPVADADALAEMVARLVRGIRNENGPENGG